MNRQAPQSARVGRASRPPRRLLLSAASGMVWNGMKWPRLRRGGPRAACRVLLHREGGQNPVQANLIGCRNSPRLGASVPNEPGFGRRACAIGRKCASAERFSASAWQLGPAAASGCPADSQAPFDAWLRRLAFRSLGHESADWLKQCRKVEGCCKWPGVFLQRVPRLDFNLPKVIAGFVRIEQILRAEAGDRPGIDTVQLQHKSSGSLFARTGVSSDRL